MPDRPPLRPLPRYVLRFGYDGAPFDGWARQPGRRTVEGEILRGVVRLGIAPTAASARLAVSSRTDRGVSARGNTLALSSRLPPAALLRALNGIAPEIRFTALAPVPESYRPRAASDRWYRYWEREAREVPPSWEAAAERLVGPVDARTFGRGVVSGAPVLRAVGSIRPRIDGDWLVLDVRARSFVWGMVRKIVGGIREVEAGRVSLEALEGAARGRRRLTLPLAEPDRLVLMETTVPVRWELERPAPSSRQGRRAEEERRASRARAAILGEVWSSAVPRPETEGTPRPRPDGSAPGGEG